MSTLSSTLQLNNSPFIRALQGANSAVTTFKANATAIATSFTALVDLGRVITGAARQLATGIRAAYDQAGALSDIAANTGAGVESLLTLEQAFINAGMRGESLTGFIGRYQAAISGFNEENQNTASALGAVGTSTKELLSLPLLDQIRKLQTGFMGLAKAEDRVAVARALFGKSGASMLALFTDPEAISTAAVQLGSLGGVLAENSAQFDKISDALGSLPRKFQQFYAGVAVGLNGDLAGLADRLNALDLTSIGKSVGEFLVQIGKMIEVLWQFRVVLIALAGQWLVNRIAASAFFATLQAGVVSASAQFSVLAAVMSRPAYALRALPLIAAQSMTAVVAVMRTAATQIMAALGPVGLALLAIQVGGMAVNAMENAHARATAASASLIKQGAANSKAIKDRVQNMTTEDERQALLADVGEQHKRARQQRDTKSEGSRDFEILENTMHMLANWQRVISGAALAAPKIAEKKDGQTTVSENVSRLGRIGGAAAGAPGFSVGTDPLLSEQRRSVRVLEEIARNTRTANNSKSDDERVPYTPY